MSTIIDTISENLQILTALALDASDCGGKVLIRLTQKLTNLEMLTVNAHSSITLKDNVVAAITANLTNLKSLRFDVSISHNGLANLAKLGSLQHMHVSCKALDKVAFEAWSNSFCRNLKSLTLFEVSYSASAAQGLCNPIKNASKLRRLSLDLAWITDDYLRAIASSCPRLEELHFLRDNSCWAVEGLQEIIDQCHRLKFLNTDWLAKSDLRMEKYRKIIFGGNKNSRLLLESEKWF